ncbi:hypothetical protein FB451DRAFT_1404138 [Mycena latifolia]|nr:hypothetical protein FB451DRAFT_1404138 [Mycena latifolia]
MHLGNAPERGSPQIVEMRVSQSIYSRSRCRCARVHPVVNAHIVKSSKRYADGQRWRRRGGCASRSDRARSDATSGLGALRRAVHPPHGGDVYVGEGVSSSCLRLRLRKLCTLSASLRQRVVRCTGTRAGVRIPAHRMKRRMVLPTQHSLACGHDVRAIAAHEARRRPSSSGADDPAESRLRVCVGAVEVASEPSRCGAVLRVHAARGHRYC